MRFEVFVASRLKLGSGGRKGSPSLNVALVGVVLAIVIMILSLVIVLGFKNEITSKIYHLDSHIKISNAAIGMQEGAFDVVDSRDIFPVVEQYNDQHHVVAGMSLIAEKPAILKTASDFKGIIYRGVDSNYDWAFLNDNMVQGRAPRVGTGSDDVNEIAMSKATAAQLGIKAGDKILTYFIDAQVKMRRCHVVGIFSTNFDNFDKSYIVGNIAQLQGVNNWGRNTGNYVGVDVNDLDQLENTSLNLYSTLATSTYIDGGNNATLYATSHTHDNNIAFFSWLKMLDMNVVVIIVLMLIVSGFTLIAALLMIVLERISMVGLLKALGATNGSIRRIFIFLTHKLIFKAVVLGNVIGIGLALIQQHFHVIKLSPEAYYMPWVPISIDVPLLIALNVGIIAISYLTLVAPSYIIATIKPTTSLHFE